jgi:hypothetical protein
MVIVVSRLFAVEVDGKATLAFEARNFREAKELCKESWLRGDLSSLKNDGIPLCNDKSKISVRLANAEEAIIFGQAVSAAEPTDDLLLAYLVELDV